MRAILLFSLSLAFLLLIAFSACDKSSDKVTNTALEENLFCGDANGDGKLNLLDAEALVAYAWLGGTLKDTIAADADNIRGITQNDMICIIDSLYLGGSPPACSMNPPDTTLPVSADTIFISNLVVPAGEDKWPVKISLKADSNLYSICFPYHYDCPGGCIACDSIVYHPAKDYSGAARMEIFSEIFGHLPIDTTNQIGALNPLRIWEGFPTDSVLLATIWFSLTPSVDSQIISIDTTTYPPSNYLILSRFEYPETIASVPVIVYE